MKNQKEKSGKSRSVRALLVLCAVIAAAIVFLLFRLNQKTGNEETKRHPEKTEASSLQAETAPAQAQPSATPAAEDAAPTKEAAPTQEVTPTPTPEPTPVPLTVISPDLLHSYYGYMVRVSDGGVALDMSSDAVIYPASMTKVMTALLAIENLPDPDEKILLSPELVDSLYAEGASMAGFSSGELVSVQDLIYGTLLPSGAEASVALAERIAGSEAAFAEMMNQKAAELGMTSTHFTNCTGLHDDQHYSTCRDIAKLFEAALQNETFASVITAREYTCEPNAWHENGLVLTSTMFALMDHTELENGAKILGGKTGTTDEAGYCLVSFASYKNDIYILVTALGPFNEAEEHYNITDAYTAYGALQG